MGCQPGDYRRPVNLPQELVGGDGQVDILTLSPRRVYFEEPQVQQIRLHDHTNGQLLSQMGVFLRYTITFQRQFIYFQLQNC